MRPLTLPQMEQQLSELHDSMLVLSCKDSGLVIGAVFFSPDRMRYQTGSLCLSYYLGESWCRQGYMSEALAALIPQLFAQGAQLLCARCLPSWASNWKVACGTPYWGMEGSSTTTACIQS